MTTTETTIDSVVKLTALEKRNQALYNQMVRVKSLTPTFTLSKVVALIMALLVHFSTACFIAFYLSIVIMAMGNIFLLQGAGLLYVLAAALLTPILFRLRPRVVAWPQKVVLPRDQFAEVYNLADRIAEAVGAPLIDGITVTPNFNASFSRLGYQQRTLLSIGLPLWMILSNQEKVALLAHEFAHSVNGDFSHRVIVSSASWTLDRWYSLALADGGPVAFFFVPVAIPGWAGKTVLRRLLLHEARRAEYYADSLAAQIAGTATVLSMLRKQYINQRFSRYVARMRLMEMAPERLFVDLQRQVETILDDPEAMAVLEQERDNQDAHTNLTHPSLRLRIQFLKARDEMQPRVLYSEEAAALSEEELTEHREAVARYLMGKQATAE